MYVKLLFKRCLSDVCTRQMFSVVYKQMYLADVCAPCFGPQAKRPGSSLSCPSDYSEPHHNHLGKLPLFSFRFRANLVAERESRMLSKIKLEELYTQSRKNSKILKYQFQFGVKSLIV